MAVNVNKRSRFTLGMMLFLSFLFACIAIGGGVLGLSYDRTVLETRNESISLARLMAMQIPLNKLQNGSKEVQPILSRLSQASVEPARITIIRKVGRRYEYIRETHPRLGEVKANETSGLISPAAQRTFDTGIPDSDNLVRLEDGTTPVLIGYAPIKSGDKVVALVMCERSADAFGVRVRRMKETLAWMALLALALSGMMGIMWATRLVKLEREVPWLRSMTTTTKLFRATILELAMVCVSLTVIISGIFGFQGLRQAETALEHSAMVGEKLEILRTRIDAVLYGELTEARKGELISGVRELHNIHLEARITRVLKAPTLDKYALRDILSEVKSLQSKQRAIQNANRDSLEAKDTYLSVSLFVTSFLAFGALILVRASGNQEQDLHAAILDSRKTRGAYDQLADSLPIGLYTFSGGKLDYTNRTWNTQTQKAQDEPGDLALRKALHPEDKDDVLIALREFEKQRLPFEMQYRMVDPSGEQRILETRGVPITDLFGNFEHMLGFTIDVTSRVQAQETIEQRNREMEQANFRLHQAFHDLELNFEGMVNSLVRAVEAKDPYTAGHSERVMGYSLKIGEALGYSQRELRILERGCLVHDIGKIGIPDAILTKPDSLLQHEYEIIKQHPVIGFNMIKDIPVFKDCIGIVRWHHERLDGTGYPDGLSEDQIPEMVRICAVADVFDALTSTRAYRKGMNMDRALQILQKDAEKGILDARLVEILTDIVSKEGLLWQPGAEDLAA